MTTSNLSGFTVAGDGSLAAIGATVVASNPAGSAKLDTALSDDGRFVYTLNAGTGTIGIFSVECDETLTSREQVNGLPASAGLNDQAAY